ncbi:hypothetical protein [Streptomyces microflavus]|uniref:hypothetical protein n=1 Tax=Streptomyces microflavus TaxID=1919 RepID=UPI0033CD5B26
MGTGPAQAASSPSVCIQAHVTDAGWQSQVCNGPNTFYYSGTVGENKAIEALRIKITGHGRFCVAAHLRDQGWHPGEKCFYDGAEVFVGTTGQNRPMEALTISVSSGSIVGAGHVQNRGWGPSKANNFIYLGTEGSALNLEAVAVGPNTW